MATQTKDKPKFMTAKERREELTAEAEEYEAANDEANAKQVDEVEKAQEKLDKHQAGVPAK